MSTTTPNRRQRVSDQALLEGLNFYRADPGNPILRREFMLLLDRIVCFAIEGMVRQNQWLQTYQDDLVQEVWDRLLTQEEKHGTLLAGYDVAAGSAVYGWIWRLCNFARLDILRVAGRTDTFVEEAQDELPTTPTPTVRDTPIKGSVLRIRALSEWMVALARQMPGQTVTLQDSDQPKTVRLTSDHEKLWLSWLAIDSDKSVASTDLLDLTEAELSNEIGVSKATVQRYTDAAFAYMLQHPQFARNLSLMIPNRLRGGVSEAQLQSEMLAALQQAKGAKTSGKNLFRQLMHSWQAWLHEQRPGH